MGTTRLTEEVAQKQQKSLAVKVAENEALTGVCFADAGGRARFGRTLTAVALYRMAKACSRCYAGRRRTGAAQRWPTLSQQSTVRVTMYGANPMAFLLCF